MVNNFFMYLNFILFLFLFYLSIYFYFYFILGVEFLRDITLLQLIISHMQDVDEFSIYFDKIPATKLQICLYVCYICIQLAFCSSLDHLSSSSSLSRSMKIVAGYAFHNERMKVRKI